MEARNHSKNVLIMLLILAVSLLLMMYFFLRNEMTAAVHSTGPKAMVHTAENRDKGDRIETRYVGDRTETRYIGERTEAKDMDAMFKLGENVTNHLFRYKGRLVIPPQEVLERLTRAELEDLYHRYVENIQYACRDQIHYGLETDGGYFVCEDVKIKPPCMMYSFGTRNDYSFDDKIANVVGCEVHSFDPGDGQTDHQRSERVFFHAIGLGGKTRNMPPAMGPKKGEWQIFTLTDMRKKLNHTERSLDILKIDTEGMIWETLVDVARPGVIDDVKLLIVELHINFPPNMQMPSYRSKSEYSEHLDSLRKLHDLGFRIYTQRRWPQCKIIDDEKNKRTGCHDVHFIQTKYVQ